MDVKSVFLYGKIEEEVYVCQPPGFEDLDFPDRVYKVEKALYGLHQAPRAWHTEVKTASTPMETQKPLLKDEDGEEVDCMPVLDNQVNPKVSHLYVVKRIFRYLKGQPKLGLWYPKILPFEYTDIDYRWKGASLDRKSTTGGQTIHGEKQLHALVDGKKIIITESSVRRDLQLEDEEGIDCLPNSTIFEQLTLTGPNTTAWNEFSSTMASAIIYLATNQKFNFSKLIFDSMIRNLDSKQAKLLMYPRKDTQVPQPSDPIESVTDEAVHKDLGDSLERDATTTSSLEAEQDSGGGPRCQETIGDTISQTGFENVSKHSNDSLLARGNTLRSDEDSLKLDELMALFGLPARVESSDNEEVWVRMHPNRGGLMLLMQMNKLPWVVIQELGESATTISSQLSSQQSHDKGKGILIEPVKPINKKDLIRLDEEAALNLQAEFDEKERLAREKIEKEEEANIVLIETWDDIQAKIDADNHLAKRMQAQEQEELSIEEKATIFQQLLEKRRKHFAAKRVEEKRNKPPTKAQ
ncbi:retrovirus-related pol polyprotein from transposon TNT 1-94 [Tanacetum coccineum]